MNTYPSRRLHYSVIAVVFAYLLFFTLKYPFDFNFEVDIALSYPLYMSAVVLVLISGWSMLAADRPVSIGYKIFFFSVVGLLLLQAISLPYFGLENEYLVMVGVVLGFLLLMRSYLGASDVPLLLRIVVLTMVVQLLIAMGQLFTSDADDRAMAITGTIGNSGIFACYLVIHIPFVGYLLGLLKGRVWVKYTLGCIYFLSVFLILYFTRSRTAIIAFAGIMLAMGLVRYGPMIRLAFKRWKWRFLGAGIAMAVLLIPVVYYLIGMKRLSAVGRLLIVRVAGEHVFDHFWFGTGIGRFTWYYPQWQAAYFRSHPNYSLDFYLSAGKTYVAFNEYLQLLEEVGIFGCLLFVYFLYRFFTCKSALYPQLLNYTKITMFGILLCGFTSYPFHVNIIVCLGAICTFIALVLRDRRVSGKSANNRGVRFRYIYFVSVPILHYAGAIGVLRNIDVAGWQDLSKRDNVGRTEAKELYRKLYGGLQRDGKFLADYGKFLMKDPEDCKEAKRFFEESKIYFYSYSTFSDEAVACERMRDYSGVIDNCQFLVSSMPNKIGPKYKMANAYFQSGNIKMAQDLARQILAMPIKNLTENVEDIKASLVRMLSVREQP